MRLFVLVFSLAACFPCNAQGQGDVGYESSSIGVNSLINAAAPHTSTLAVGIYSQPNIVAEFSGLISGSTTYALPAWTGASLRPSESAPDISTLTVGIYSQPNIAESSGLISASTTYALPAWTGASLQSSESAPDISTLTMGISRSRTSPNLPV